MKKEIVLPKKYDEGGAYEPTETVFCLNNETSFHGHFTEQETYYVLAYEAEGHIILLNDDTGHQEWVEAENFIPLDILELLIEDLS